MQYVWNVLQNNEQMTTPTTLFKSKTFHKHTEMNFIAE